MSTLVVTVGLPRAGKTRWARAQGFPIVNPDSIRLALHGMRFVPEAEGFVWAIAKVMVRALFLAGHDFVILDACNVSRKRRDEWVDRWWNTTFALVATPAETCVARAEMEGDQEIIPVIQRMADGWEDLGADEARWP